MENDPTSYEEAMSSSHSSKWLEAMEDEMKSMSSNEVWDLEEIPKGAKTVGCKWVYKPNMTLQEYRKIQSMIRGKRIYTKRRNRLQ